MGLEATRKSTDGVDPLRLVTLLVASLGAMILAAKAHGRQVRLEREHAGHHHVVFGGINPEFVETLWRRDRIRFWGSLPVFVGVIAGGLAWRHGIGAHLAAALFLGALAAFTLAGAGSRRELARAGGRDEAGRRWWAGVAVAAAGVAWLAS